LVDGVVAKGMVRVGTLMAMLPVLREFQVDVPSLLAEYGLQEPYLADPDNTVPYAIVGLLLRRCTEITDCSHLGIIIGRSLSPSSLGPVGFLASSAPDVRTALTQLSRYFRFHNPNATVDVIEDASHATLRFTLLISNLEGRDQILDGAIANAFNTMRRLCGPGWKPIEVRLARDRPRDVAPYRKFFGPAVRFNADESAVIFSSHWLDAANPAADPMLHLLMKKRIHELEISSGESVVGQVRRMLPPLVHARAASIGAVANLIGLSARTLNRRLAAENMTFMQLRMEALHAAACQLLESTRVPANEIADRLGYANPSAFTRAFHRWAGMAPAEWRTSRQRRTRKHRAGIKTG
jgi:AraC-like DNA-binding protein